MEFKHEALVEREIEIARYLLNDLSLKEICENAGLKRKIVVAHIRNMMQKLKAGNIEALVKVLRGIKL